MRDSALWGKTDTLGVQVCQKMHRIIVKFGLGVQNEAGQRLRQFCQENTLL